MVAPRKRHVVLTSHPRLASKAPQIHWGAPTARERGPINAGQDPAARNAIGAHAGSYALYRALAIAAGKLSPEHVADLTDTTPAEKIGPHPQWADPKRIVSLDPWGHWSADAFADEIAAGIDIRPTIAITKAHVDDARDPGRHGGRPPQARRRHPARHRRRAASPRSRSTRSGTCRASPSASAISETDAAPRAVRADRRHVSRAGDAPRSERLPAADRRHHLSTSSAMSQARSDPTTQARLPRARRMQRLGRVRLRHLHLPALSRARHRGVHRRRRRTAASA